MYHMIESSISTRTFYCPEAPAHVRLPRIHLTIIHPLSWLEGLHGSGHPDPDFKVLSPQHSQQPCSRSTGRKKVPCHGFHDNRREFGVERAQLFLGHQRADVTQVYAERDTAK